MKAAWKVEYARLYEEDFKKKYPTAYKDQGAPEMKWPKVSTANGLTMAIIRLLTWKGYYANRISTQGQARVHRFQRFDIMSGKLVDQERTRWTKGNTKRGTPDISAIVHGKAVWIEVKIGKDKMSKAQEEQKVEIETAGGLYFIAKTMEEFYEWYINKFERTPGAR